MGLEQWTTLSEAASHYNVAKSTISRIVRRHNITTTTDVVDQRLLLIDREQLHQIMNASMKYHKQGQHTAEEF